MMRLAPVGRCPIPMQILRVRGQKSIEEAVPGEVLKPCTPISRLILSVGTLISIISSIDKLEYLVHTLPQE